MSILARPRPANTFSLATLFLAFGVVIAAVISARVPNPETAEAATATIGASKDNPLYSESGSLSNGAGSYIFTGRTRDGLNRRTLIAFDIAGNVPAGLGHHPPRPRPPSPPPRRGGRMPPATPGAR